MTQPHVLFGDALEKLPSIADGSIDLIVADPPYNLGKDYGNGSDARGREEYLLFTRRWVEECTRVLRDGGTLYAFMGFRFISYLYDVLEQEQGLDFAGWIVWHYTQGVGKRRGFSPRHDDVLMFTKGEGFTFNLDDVRVPQKFYRERNNMRGANPGDVWEFSHVHYCNANRQAHPTQKPEGLIERMVLASSNQGDQVLDPFSGSGTTLRVCQQLGRECLGIEINPLYVDATRERLEQSFTGFDSVDPRMSRIPRDLRREEIRRAYLKDHREWFLRNHENASKDFDFAVADLYGESLISRVQPSLLDE